MTRTRDGSRRCEVDTVLDQVHIAVLQPDVQLEPRMLLLEAASKGLGGAVPASRARRAMLPCLTVSMKARTAAGLAGAPSIEEGMPQC
jgi:hypothetical protein